jgi:hypothetical protein
MTQMPSHNSGGYQVWNPSVGNYFKPASNDRESYAGVVAALQDQIKLEGGQVRAFPASFAGIISAIQALTFTIDEAPVDPGVKPDGGYVEIDDEGNPIWIITEEPKNGDLWFDTRQGRLFIAWEGEYFQTNGADGLAIVTATTEAPQSPVLGQFWWDVTTTSLYIFDGFWQDTDGNIDGNWSEGATPIWRAVTSTAGGDVSTATLPLAAVTTTSSASILPDITERTMNVQKDYNEWVNDALESCEAAIEVLQNEEPPCAVTISTTAPENPEPGNLWFDSATLELSVYYQDNSSAQWVPTSVSYVVQQDLATLSTRITEEERVRNLEVQEINQTIEEIKADLIPDVTELEVKVDALENSISGQIAAGLSEYVTDSDLVNACVNLTNQINAVNAEIPDVTSYATVSALGQLEAAVTLLSSKSYVDNAITAAAPNLSAFVTQSDINTSISNITTEYLPRTGGTLTGSFVMNKQDVGLPGLDFSTSDTDSRQVFKFVANDGYGDLPITTFGTNDNYWEFAHNFSSNEDFCWVYGDSNKVFSITKDGPACSQLHLANFQQNTTDGRVLTNTIEVGETLRKYQLAFESIRQGVANSTDFDSLKANLTSALASV